MRARPRFVAARSKASGSNPSPSHSSRSLSAAARVEAGVLLRRLQAGELVSMPHSRPMPAIGPRCHELRINDRDHTWRVMYRIDPDAIVILEVFGKKTGTTPAAVLAACRARAARYDRASKNLARRLRDVRTRRRLSQEAMAKLLGSSQSRVAKMEAGDRSVSVDLLVRSLLLVGASRAEIAREIGRPAA
jgi:phage-related protein